jgi:hypothetical protein
MLRNGMRVGRWEVMRMMNDCMSYVEIPRRLELF